MQPVTLHSPYVYVYQFRMGEGQEIHTVFSRVRVRDFEVAPFRMFPLYMHAPEIDVIARGDFEAMCHRVNELTTELKLKNDELESLRFIYTQIRHVADKYKG